MKTLTTTSNDKNKNRKMGGNINQKSTWRSEDLSEVLEISKLAKDKFIGVSEILIQHAESEKDYGHNSGTKLSLIDGQLSEIIEELKNKNIP